MQKQNKDENEAQGICRTKAVKKNKCEESPPILDGAGPPPQVADGSAQEPPILDGAGPPPIVDGPADGFAGQEPQIADGSAQEPPILDGAGPPPIVDGPADGFAGQ